MLLKEVRIRGARTLLAMPLVIWVLRSSTESPAGINQELLAASASEVENAALQAGPPDALGLMTPVWWPNSKFYNTWETRVRWE